MATKPEQEEVNISAGYGLPLTPVEDALLTEYFEQEEWGSARRLIQQALVTAPNNHWLLTRLSTTYYEQHDYERAEEYARNALRVAPRCPLARWDCAGALDMLGREQDAIEIWKELVAQDVQELAYDECGEGLRWAQSLVNDSRYRIGLSYLSLGNTRQARKYLMDHLRNRKRGLPSLYRLAEVKRRIDALR